MACAFTLDAAPSIKLSGIVNLPDRQVALLEIREGRAAPKLPILRAGETGDGCKVIEINPSAGTATVQWGDAKEPLTLYLRTDIAQLSRGAVTLDGAELRQALDVYQELSGRTVVHSGSLVHSPVTLWTAPNASSEACGSEIEKALKAKGTLLKLRGKQFAFAIPPRQENIVERIPEPPPIPAAPDANDEVFPRGAFKFENTDALRVLGIYSELTGRTILRPNAIPHSIFTVRSQSPHTRAQLVWLIEAAVTLGGLRLEPTGEKFAYAVPSDRALPAIDLTAAEAKIKKASGVEHIKIEEGDVQQLLTAYSTTIGREPLPIPPELPRMEISLHTHAPLTVVERAFALEVVAALNYLAFDLVGEEHVAVRHSSTPPAGRK